MKSWLQVKLQRSSVRAVIAAAFAYGLASCAVAPSGVDTASTKPDVAAAGTTPVAAVVPIAIRVVPSLREAVGRVFSEHPTFRGVVLVDEATGAAEYRIALTYQSSVDISRQIKNREGAAMGGMTTLLLTAIVPWSCPTTHTLFAVVTRSNGEEVASYQVIEVEKMVGGMTWCPDVTEPGGSVAAKMASEAFRRIAADNVLHQSSGRP